MDITLVSHLGSAGSTTDANRASVARGPQPVAKPPAVDAGKVLVEKSVAVSAVEIAEAVQALEAAELPIPMTVRSEQATLELETIEPGAASGWRRVPFLGFSGPATITVLSPPSNCTAQRPPFEVGLAMCARP